MVEIELNAQWQWKAQKKLRKGVLERDTNDVGEADACLMRVQVVNNLN